MWEGVKIVKKCDTINHAPYKENINTLKVFDRKVIITYVVSQKFLKVIQTFSLKLNVYVLLQSFS